MHERPVRVNDVSYAYGECETPTTVEGGCVPPLQIISSPGCERPHSLYHRYVGPPELALGPEPHRDVTFRGVKVAVFDDGKRLEIYTHNATVSVEATTPRIAVAAARRIVASPTSRSGQRKPEAVLPQASDDIKAEQLPSTRPTEPAAVC